MGKKNRRPEWRTFWFSLGAALFVFLTGAGLLAVDYQGRKLSFGDATPPVVLDRQADPPQLQVKAFGVDEHWDAASLDKLLDFLCDFGCLPHS